MLQHHYIPNSQLYVRNFTEEKTRIQMGSYLWASTQIKDGDLVLNNVATVLENDIPITNVSISALLVFKETFLTVTRVLFISLIAFLLEMQ